MLSSLLKERTKRSHQSLEAVVIRAIKSIRNKEGYIDLLHRFYGFHHPLEQLQDKFLGDANVPAYSSRRKASVILDDLNELKAPLPSVSATELPLIDSPAAALGSFYVTEGSTNGGSIVAGMLIKYAGMNENNTRFFYGYGDNGKEMWQSFKDELDKNNDPSFTEKAIKAADETFRLFQLWMSEDR